jgi:hypothetical protein
MFLIMVVVIYGYLLRARGGKIPSVRTLPPLEAIEEIVGRAVEMQRPVHMSTGSGAITGSDAREQVAGLAIMSYVARQVAKVDANPITTTAQPAMVPIYEEIMQSAWVAEGKPESYTVDQVRFVPAFSTGVMAIVNRERVAGNILIGPFYSESLVLLETGNRVGAIQIAGTASRYQLPFMIAVADYVLISEEMFAAAAYVSGDPIDLGTVAGQDIVKLVTIALMIIGTLTRLAGSTFLIDLLSM